MPTAPLTGDTAAPTVDEQFLDLICNDPDLVAAEFEAIIAAESPEPPARPPRHGATGEHRRNGRPSAPAGAAPDSGPRAPDPDIDCWARQRSPPLGQPQTRRDDPRRPAREVIATPMNQFARGDGSPRQHIPTQSV